MGTVQNNNFPDNFVDIVEFSKKKHFYDIAPSCTFVLENPQETPPL